MNNNINLIDAEWARNIIREKQAKEIIEHMKICEDLIVEAVEKGWFSASVEKIAINDFVVASLIERGFKIVVKAQDFGHQRITHIKWKP